MLLIFAPLIVVIVATSVGRGVRRDIGPPSEL
jgi:hypothetical protein